MITQEPVSSISAAEGIDSSATIARINKDSLMGQDAKAKKLTVVTIFVMVLGLLVGCSSSNGGNGKTDGMDGRSLWIVGRHIVEVSLFILYNIAGGEDGV